MLTTFMLRSSLEGLGIIVKFLRVKSFCNSRKGGSSVFGGAPMFWPLAAKCTHISQSRDVTVLGEWDLQKIIHTRYPIPYKFRTWGMPKTVTFVEFSEFMGPLPRKHGTYGGDVYSLWQMGQRTMLAKETIRERCSRREEVLTLSDRTDGNSEFVLANVAMRKFEYPPPGQRPPA